MKRPVFAASLIFSSVLASTPAKAAPLVSVASASEDIAHVRVISGNAHLYPSADKKSLSVCGGDYYVHIVSVFKGLDRVIGIRVDSRKLLTPGNEYIMFWSFPPYSPRVDAPEEYIYKDQLECEQSLRGDEDVNSEWIGIVESGGPTNESGRTVEFDDSPAALPIPRAHSPACSGDSCYDYDWFVNYLKESLK